MTRHSAFGERLADLRAEHGLSLRQLGDRAHFSRSFLWDLEKGNKLPSPTSAARLDKALNASGQLAILAASAPQAPDSEVSPATHQVETLRRQVTEAISTSGLGPAAAEDWEQTALEHGRATRYSHPAALLSDLTADFTELYTQLYGHHTSSTLRCLTRVTAQMAGLMFLTLIKLDEQDAARSWARTARLAAREAGDPPLHSWVRAQEAFVHYYSGHLGEALDVARHAQDLVGGLPCVGAALAAALEARVLGRLSHRDDAKAAIGTAESILSDLDAESVTASAFGYNEAQLRFHEGNALTHLGDTEDAWCAQQRALKLYPDSDYLDRALVRLDRASCLARDGDATTALGLRHEGVDVVDRRGAARDVDRPGPGDPQLAAVCGSRPAGGYGLPRSADDHIRGGRDRSVVLAIAHAEVADVSALADLLAELDRFYGATVVAPLTRREEEIREALFGPSPAACTLLAKDDQNVVGLASYSFLWPAAGLTRSMFLKEIYVRQDRQREGVGRRLMQALGEIATAAGCSRLEWQTEDENEQAKQFYKSLGAPIHAGKVFYRLEGMACDSWPGATRQADS